MHQLALPSVQAAAAGALAAAQETQSVMSHRY